MQLFIMVYDWKLYFAIYIFCSIHKSLISKYDTNTNSIILLVPPLNLSLYLDIFFILIRESCVLGFLQVLLIFSSQGWVHIHSWRFKGWHLNDFQVRVTNELLGQPQEWFFKIVVTFGTYIVVLGENKDC